MNRATHPWFPSIIKARFDVTVDAADWAPGVEAIATARAAMIKRLGEHGYWINHLDYTRTEITLVNSNNRQRIDDTLAPGDAGQHTAVIRCQPII
jgi:hypothetical protein